MSILPTGHASVSPSGSTRWRDFDVTDEEVVSYPLIEHGAREITRRLLEDVKSSVLRWKQLLDRLSDIPDEDLDSLLVQLRESVQMIINENDRTALWNHIRKVMNHHREFPEAEWSLGEDKVSQLEKVYTLITPHDPIQQIGWLFNHGVALARPTSDWEKNEQLVATARKKESVQLLKGHGIDAVFELAGAVVDAWALGRAIAHGDIEPEQLAVIVERGLRSHDVKHQQMAQGAIGARAKPQDPWFESLVKKAVHNDWGSEPLMLILQSLRPSKWTWLLAREAGEDADREYWRTVEVRGIDASEEETGLVVTKLLDAGRAREVISFIGNKNRLVRLSTKELIQVLQKAAVQPFIGQSDHNSGVMFQYYLEQTLSHLDLATDVVESDMLAIELAYLPILEHSKRPPKVIPKAMAESPELFVHILCAIFRPSPDSGIVEEIACEAERVSHTATQAFNILRIWDVIPGTGPDGKISQNALDKWVKHARKLAKSRGRGEIADQRIGEVLAHSPVGEDGIWPALEVRELIETLRSEHVETGFAIGRQNHRGVTTRLLREGGSQERALAAQYRAYAAATAFEWHRTSAVLNVIADGYETEAKLHDESANRLDW